MEGQDLFNLSKIQLIELLKRTKESKATEKESDEKESGIEVIEESIELDSVTEIDPTEDSIAEIFEGCAQIPPVLSPFKDSREHSVGNSSSSSSSGSSSTSSDRLSGLRKKTPQHKKGGNESKRGPESNKDRNSAERSKGNDESSEKRTRSRSRDRTYKRPRYSHSRDRSRQRTENNCSYSHTKEFDVIEKGLQQPEPGQSRIVHLLERIDDNLQRISADRHLL